MTDPIRMTTAVFAQPFRIAGFDETLPAGDYDLDYEPRSEAVRSAPADWRDMVLVRLHPRDAWPGLAQSLVVPLAALERANGRDKASGAPLGRFILDKMLSDPVMLRAVHPDGMAASPPSREGVEATAAASAGNEGLPARGLYGD